MEIKPFRAYTDDAGVSKFPAAKLIYHADDFTSGGTTWVDRISGVTLNFTAAVSKDSEGIYSTTAFNGVASVTGTMPTLDGKYAVLLAIGALQDASATVGLTITVGSSGSVSVSNSGAATNATNSVTAQTLSGSITAGSKACRAGYWDMVDTTSPLCAAVLASASDVAANQAIPNSSTNTTSDTGQLVMGAALSNAFGIQSINSTTAGQRTKIIALFEFSTDLTLAQLQVACSEMARTQELFAGWRNRT